ncbi:MAG: ribonuclease HII [Firmicutes bacterium]|nr:ribonuclease HII [Bacillota bacterium]
MVSCIGFATTNGTLIPAARRGVRSVDGDRLADERVRQAGLLVFEERLWAQGHTRVAGVDEAGRGPLAGPVVAAAVVMPRGLFLPGLDDSKRLSPALREEICRAAMAAGVEFGLGGVEAAVIDELNIYRATKRAMLLALERLVSPPDFILLDAVPLPEYPYPQEAVVHGDARCLSIALASVFAKVARDRLMGCYDRRFPGYGFAKHKGYPTPEHYAALQRLGPCPIHRRSFNLGLSSVGLFDAG